MIPLRGRFVSAPHRFPGARPPRRRCPRRLDPVCGS